MHACPLRSLRCRLAPERPAGTLESGVMKTTEDLSIAIPNRSYGEVWAAAEKAMRAQITLVSADPARGVLRGADVNFLGLDKGYVGVFITPTTPAAPSYTVEVSKILKNRTSIDMLQDFEVAILAPSGGGRGRVGCARRPADGVTALLPAPRTSSPAPGASKASSRHVVPLVWAARPARDRDAGRDRLPRVVLGAPGAAARSAGA